MRLAMRSSRYGFPALPTHTYRSERLSPYAFLHWTRMLELDGECQTRQKLKEAGGNGGRGQDRVG